jgi:AraC family transcriptional regulator of arabinose operon
MNYSFHTKTLYYMHRINPAPNAVNHIMHSHEDEYQLLLVFSGNLSYHLSDKIYRLKPNSFILVRPEETHYPAFRDNSTPFHSATLYVKICKSNEGLVTLLEELFADTAVLSVENPTAIQLILQQIDEYVSHFPKNITSKLLSLKFKELLHVLHQTVYPLEVVTSHEYNQFQDILDFIAQNRYTLKSVEEITNKFNVSKSQLYILFQKELKQPPMAYVLTCRLQDAHRLIKSGNHPHSIYFLCGFSDYPNFYRLYKKKYGVSPSETYKNSNVNPE